MDVLPYCVCQVFYSQHILIPGIQKCWTGSGEETVGCQEPGPCHQGLLAAQHPKVPGRISWI